MRVDLLWSWHGFLQLREFLQANAVYKKHNEMALLSSIYQNVTNLESK